MKLADVSTVKSGYPFRGAIKEHHDGDALVVRMQNIDRAMSVRWDEVVQTKLVGRGRPDWLEAGDILFSAKGSRNIAIALDGCKENAVASPNFFVLKVRKDSSLLPEFLAWQINQRGAQRYFSQSASGSYIPHIRRQVLESLRIAVPPLEQQQRIVSFVKSCQQEKALLQQLMDNTDRQMDAVAQSVIK